MLKITAEKQKLLDGLSKAQSIIDKKTIMQIINNVHLYTDKDELVIEATDLEIFFRTKIPVEVEEEGEITITPRKLYEIVREIPKEKIILEETENYWLKIPVEGQAEYSLAGMASEEFPHFIKYPDTNLVRVSSEIMKDMIERTIFSVSIDERTYALSGILMEVERDEESGTKKIRMVSSDGHRLNFIEYGLEEPVELEENMSFIFLRKGANEIKKLADSCKEMFFTADKKYFYLNTDKHELVIRLIEGTFPEYREIIPKEKERSFFFSKNLMTAALRRVSIFIPDPSFKGVKFSVTPNQIKIESLDKKIGQATEYFNISYSGEPFELALNARYLMEALNVMKSETIEFTFNNEDSPCTIVGDEDKGFLGLIMPMSLEEI